MKPSTKIVLGLIAFFILLFSAFGAGIGVGRDTKLCEECPYIYYDYDITDHPNLGRLYSVSISHKNLFDYQFIGHNNTEGALFHHQDNVFNKSIYVNSLDDKVAIQINDLECFKNKQQNCIKKYVYKR